VMISNTIAYLISRRFQEIPIFEVLTKQDGLDLPSMEMHREAKILRVEDAMSPPPSVILSAEDTVQAALDLSQKVQDSAGMLLANWDSGRWTRVQVKDLRAAVQQGKAGVSLRDAVPGIRLPRLHPDQSLDLALRLMRDSGFHPVIHRAEPHRLIGVLGLDGILEAYRQARQEE